MKRVACLVAVAICASVAQSAETETVLSCEGKFQDIVSLATGRSGGQRESHTFIITKIDGKISKVAMKSPTYWDVVFTPDHTPTPDPKDYSQGTLVASSDTIALKVDHSTLRFELSNSGRYKSKVHSGESEGECVQRAKAF